MLFGATAEDSFSTLSWTTRSKAESLLLISLTHCLKHTDRNYVTKEDRLGWVSWQKKEISHRLFKSMALVTR
jgi:hypothetical protein